MNHGRADPIQIDIPKGSYVPSFAVNPSLTETDNSSDDASPARAPAAYDSALPGIAVFEFESLNDQDNNSFIVKGLAAEIVIEQKVRVIISEMSQRRLAQATRWV